MDLKLFAAQLRKPEGDYGKQIGQLMNTGNYLINEWTIDELSLKAGDKVLEIGMGNGFFVKDLFKIAPGIRYEGLDYSSIMIDESQQLNRSFVESKQANFTLGSVETLPYTDAGFSKIFTINTIYFWGDAMLQLAEIKRVLQPQGVFVIAVRSKETMQQMPFTEYGFVKYDQQDLINLLKSNGFKILSSIQKKEPSYQFNGNTVQLENIIITCTR